MSAHADDKHMSKINSHELFHNTIEEIKPGLKKLQGVALAMLVLGALCSVGGFATQGIDHFFYSYLTSYMFWFGITAGSIGVLLLHNTVGGGWGFIIRRLIEAATRCLPLVFVFFLPIALVGTKFLYSWTNPNGIANAEERAIVLQKAAWLNTTGFTGRGIAYFVIWGVFVFLLNKWGALYDQPGDHKKNFDRLNVLGGFGLLVHVLLTTFMAVDWVMSITPTWVSSILGALLTAGQGLAALALMNILVGTIGVKSSLIKFIPQRYFRDLGNLMMALVLFWSYCSFSTYLIQYSGNIAEDVAWFVVRRHGGWGYIGLSLIFLHFALPFGVLLSSSMKTNPRNLWKIAAFILFMRWVDMLFLTRPSLEPQMAKALGLSDIGTWCLMGGAWLLLWIYQVQKRPLVPAYDPRFAYNWEVHEHEHSHGDFHEDNLQFAVEGGVAHDEHGPAAVVPHGEPLSAEATN